jgi:hypothetical protein
MHSFFIEYVLLALSVWLKQRDANQLNGLLSSKGVCGNSADFASAITDLPCPVQGHNSGDNWRLRSTHAAAAS